MKKIYLTSLFLFLSALLFSQDITLDLLKNGFTEPLNLQHANDSRLFVVEKGGKIKILNPGGSVNPSPFLDISMKVSTQGEQGLLGLAFHPDYATNGYFFVNYTDLNGDTRISRYSVDPANANVADPISELLILGYSQPFTNHNGGNLEFGPSGNLFISSGDGGGSGDPNNNAQNINSFLGKILRIDVDNPTNGKNYGIPADNPFIGQANAKEEIFAYGLRNPWRFSIDSDENTIWIADVGQGNLEEVNRAPLTSLGLNYGWRCFEGSQPFNTQNCPPQSATELPLAEYSHTNGNCSITGGQVYRGAMFSSLTGLYFYADFCSGLIGTIDNLGNTKEHGKFNGNWVSFGEDVNKELYILDFTGGAIYQIQENPITGVPDFNAINVTILPNPASQNILVSSKNERISAIEIFDLNGRSVYSKENIHLTQRSISVRNLRSGIYLVKITTENLATTIKKIIVQ